MVFKGNTQRLHNSFTFIVNTSYWLQYSIYPILVALRLLSRDKGKGSWVLMKDSK
jgi:hypothetical protein